MIENFRTYTLAVEFYKATRGLKLPVFLRDQLQRAASSVALNLAEGRGKETVADQRRFFSIAFGSVRECQAILTLAELEGTTSWGLLDSLAGHLYKLLKRAGH
jgi:four helix bundle protein